MEPDNLVLMDAVPSNTSDRPPIKEDNALSSKKILVADDEPFLIRILSYALKKEGYEVQVAMDGLDALEKARALKPHLILLDLQLPKVHGLEVTREIRNDPKLKDTRIILLTASLEKREKCLSAGADEFITKPFRLKELMISVQKLFNN